MHNQEHAFDLIKNIIKIVKVFSYFKITNYDYYMLFISCYLHDISMVRTASPNDFLLDPAADKITYELSEFWGKSDILNNQKEAATITYKRLDDFYEQKIRSNHGKNSGDEIRTRDDLLFWEPSLRENVAEISESHTIDARVIYFIKGEAKNKLVSLKFDKILLRLADLLKHIYFDVICKHIGISTYKINRTYNYTSNQLKLLTTKLIYYKNSSAVHKTVEPFYLVWYFN